MVIVKKLLTFLLTVLLLNVQRTAAQNTNPDNSIPQPNPSYRNLIKLDLFSPLASMLAIDYERCINENLSWQVELRTVKSGFILTPELRYYLSNSPAPSGIYLAPWLRIGNGIRSFNKGATFGAGLCVGAQMVKRRIGIGVFLGPAVYAGSNAKPLTFVRGGLTLAYAF